MTPITFRCRDSLVPKKDISRIKKTLNREIERIKSARELSYEDERSSINLPFDRENLAVVKSLVKEKTKLNPSYLILVGVGGSSLGAMAIQEAVLGKFYNHFGRVKIIYTDTVDQGSLDSVIKIIEPELRKGRNIILNMVSKSGSTVETVVNFEVLLGVLKKHRKDYEKYVVVATNRDSVLWKLALLKNFSVLEIPAKVGGRYSVFSSAGLFPLGMIGVDLEKLLEGARYSVSGCMKEDSPASLFASLAYYHWKKGRNIFNMFFYETDFESVGKWHRQLMAESLGKEKDSKGKRISAGITPIVSLPQDLHSMAQLYLGGPHDKFTAFISIRKNRGLRVPVFQGYDALVKNIQGRHLNEITKAIYEGVKAAFKKSGMPFTETLLPDSSEHSVGQFLQFAMIEMMCLGYLLNVNPFDQPSVEAYKAEIRRMLQRK